jgi:hypothetical protein
VKIVADEGVDAPIVARLRAEGHEVLYVAELAPGLRDQEVVALASRLWALGVSPESWPGASARRKEGGRGYSLSPGETGFYISLGL